MSAADGNTASNGFGQADRPTASHCVTCERPEFSSSVAIAGPAAARVTINAKSLLMIVPQRMKRGFLTPQRPPNGKANLHPLACAVVAVGQMAAPRGRHIHGPNV